MSIAYPESLPYGFVVMVGKGSQAYETYGTDGGNHFYSVNSAERFASSVPRARRCSAALLPQIRRTVSH